MIPECRLMLDTLHYMGSGIVLFVFDVAVGSRPGEITSLME